MSGHKPKSASSAAPQPRLVNAWSSLLLVLSMLAPNRALALPGYEPSLVDGAFYAFGMTGVAFTSITILVLRQPRYLLYSGYTLLLLLLWSSLDGTLTYLVGGDQIFADSAPLVVMGFAAGYGYFMAAYFIEVPHRLASVRPWLCTLACFCLAIPMGLGSFSYFSLYLPMNILVYLGVAVQVLPPLTWTHLTSLQLRWAIAMPLTMTVLTLGIYVAHFTVLNFDREELDIVNRLLFLVYAGFGLVAATLNVLTLVKERERAELDSLRAAKREAEMQLALQEAEQEYQHARDVASRSTEQLASASHDLKQPIAALRMSLERMRSEPGSNAEKTAEQMLEAVGYVDQLAQSYRHTALAELEAEAASEGRVREYPMHDQEELQVSVLFDTLETMFRDDAEQRGVELKFSAEAMRVTAAPLAAMRILSNALSNAVQHANGDQITVSAHPVGDQIRFRVRDNGRGLDDKALQTALQRGAKSEESSGEGMGMNIAMDLAQRYGYRVEFSSQPSAGMIVDLFLPRAPDRAHQDR